MGKKLQGQTVLEGREDKQKVTKAKIEMSKLQQKETNEHTKLEKKIKIAEQELEASKIDQVTLKDDIVGKTKENATLRKALDELLEANSMLSRKIIEKKSAVDQAIRAETKNMMKQDRYGTSEALLKKLRKDEYIKEVINCNNHLALDSKHMSENHKCMKQKLTELEDEVGRVRKKIKMYRKRKWKEKALVNDDYEIFKTALAPEKGLSAKDAELKLPSILRERSEVIIPIAQFK